MNEEYYLLRERRVHGNAMFPFMIYELETDVRTYERVSCHWHEEMELLVITDGCAEVNIDGRSYQGQKGNIFIIPPDCLHSFGGKPGVPFAFYAMDFPTAFLNSATSDGIQQSYIDCVQNGNVLFPTCLAPKEAWEYEAAQVLERIRRIFFRQEPGYELLVKAGLYELWYLLFTHAGSAAQEEPASADDRLDIARAVIGYIKKHYAELISLEQLSREFGISRGHLCRLFKSIAKMTVVEYMNYYRISMSVFYLRETTRGISEIAGMSGFANISYFNRVFRSYMHMTPKEYRRLTASMGTAERGAMAGHVFHSASREVL